VAVTDTLVAVLALVGLVTTSCDLVGPDAAVADDPGGTLTANAVRACLEQRPREEEGLLFRTTSKSSDNFVGVMMMDLTASRTTPATVGIAVHDDAELLDAYEERAREDPEETVTRVQNAVVSFHGEFTGRLVQGRRWVQLCLGVPHGRPASPRR
jgi:hypothetical protein